METKFVILDSMNDTGGDDTTSDKNAISLDDLIKGPGSGVESSSADMDPAKLDALLFSQDPKFKEQMAELRKGEIKAEIEADFFDSGALESLEIKRDKVSAPTPEEIVAKPPLKERLTFYIRNLLAKVSNAEFKPGVLLGKIINSARATARQLILLITQFKTLSPRAKWSVVGLITFTILIGLMIQMLMEGDFLPSFEMHLLPTVAAQADQSWTYDEKEPTDDFFSSIRHPEHVVLLERLVVNVKPSENSGPNPMGFFEFYIEGSSEEAAIEINDRKAEVKDTMQRTIEGITYDDLVTPAGKNKLKLVLRKNINTVLTTGRVRKLFFKSVVIKP
jgi:flagellar basal body-associated protein FliL